MCEKCLYRNNCQFLTTHKGSAVKGCTAFKSETDIKSEVAREIFAEIEKLKYTKWDWNEYVDWDAIAELKMKYTEGKSDG